MKSQLTTAHADGTSTHPEDERSHPSPDHISGFSQFTSPTPFELKQAP